MMISVLVEILVGFGFEKESGGTGEADFVERAIPRVGFLDGVRCRFWSWGAGRRASGGREIMAGMQGERAVGHETLAGGRSEMRKSTS